MEAILPHVAFDGWSDAAFRRAAADRGMTEAAARVVAPRGAVDLAVTYHRQGDEAMRAALVKEDLSALRFRDRIARAVRLRLDVITDREAVRRSTALFALPHLAAEGGRQVWDTADAIWTALGDSSDDINWYTKRMTLSAVYASAVLYWLGDDSLDQQATTDFIDRRIDDVMQIEKLKAQVNDNRLLRPLLGPLGALMGRVRPPARTPPLDLPGSWTTPR
ncbi:hypothetical protein OG2516_09163 [Oceanicola granulosus HTCC2516]|uniref:COQ9 C-terminal domain-containing protein n=1 Tax=Oceanicola granulosus (strain ATCC BAA-861 / DSM 15982 / KCTC 12143 / HTCC2516) TaxID=314256 RepID=Q2CA89_OCEGH|nr:hypothetical protein OG2516_09163 [Oceanicola granulosus HTCC2516]